MIVRHCKDSPAFVLTFPQNAGRMSKNSANLKKNELVGQGLADIRQRETPVMFIMQIRYPCIAFVFTLQHIRKIHNGIHRHSEAFVIYVKQTC